MRRRLTTLYMLFAVMCSLPLKNLQAEGYWYGSLDYGVMDVTVNKRSYFPRMLNVSAGRWLFNGIGLELEIGTGMQSSEKKGVDIAASAYQGAYLRWQSPQSSGLSAYFLTGYGRLQLDGSVDVASSYPGREWFDGPVVGIGLHGKHANLRHWGATLGYKHYFLEKELTTDSVSLGIRYDF